MLTYKQHLLNEGGNVFKGKTAPIKKEHIAPTLEKYFEELKRLFPQKAAIFNDKKFSALGSVGKKDMSGDIDLGIDAKHLLDKNISDKAIQAWNLDPAVVKTEFEALKKRAKTASDSQLMMKAFLKVLCKYINENAPNLHTDEKKVTPGNIFGFYPQFDEKGRKLPIGVQLDWMVGDLRWLKFSYYSAAYPKGSNVKGLHRTQLLLSAFQQANLSFNHVSGVKDKATGETIATDPKTALAVLSDRINVKLTPSVVNDYYKLHNLLKSKMSKIDYDGMIDIYFKILDSTRADIPDDLQDEWRKRKNSLGLTGKFLPDNSRLKDA